MGEHGKEVGEQGKEFYRSLLLPAGVKADAAQAKFQDGVLEISLPKASPPEAKKLMIESA